MACAIHRAHQASYTANASDVSEWGTAEFTGRRPDTAEALAPQDGLYTLITRSAEGDTFEVMGPISAVHPASDHPGADRARSAVEADDEPTAISGVLETLSSGLGDDSELVRVIIEQMAALQR